MIKLKSMKFPINPIRKLKKINIDFGERFTVIAGFNGIGKSTILGLIASASGTFEKNYFNKPFSVDINEIIHFDPVELQSGKLKSPWPSVTYTLTIAGQKIEHWKNVRITKRPNRLRSVASTDKYSPNKSITGQDAKIPLPTIYLGMSRMLPIGESKEANVISEDEIINSIDAEFLMSFVNKVIGGTKLSSKDKLTSQSIKNTEKSSKHPDYGYTSKSISLGQDSLSTIATAIASFNKLKRDLGDDYPGGLLVIDEIDAGFHPHAQQKLIDALGNVAKNLPLQIVATTHSPRVIEYIHPESKIKDNSKRSLDKVIYLSGVNDPQSADNWSLEKILADMSLSPLPIEKKVVVPTIKAYLEDNEAAIFMKAVLGMTKNIKTYSDSGTKKRLKIIPIGVGCSSILQLPTHDDYFKTVLLVLDGDNSKNPKNITNIINLPASKNSSGHGFNPERTLYHYVEELVKGSNGQFKDTYDKLFNQGYSTDRLEECFLSKKDIDITKRESAKKWFKAVYNQMVECNLIKLWANDHQQEVSEFKKELKAKLEDLVILNLPK